MRLPRLRIETGDEAAVADTVRAEFEKNGWRTKVSEEDVSTYATDESGKKDFERIEKQRFYYVFGEKGRWNRVGAYIVHVFLLILFLGHFVAHQFGFDADVRLNTDGLVVWLERRG